MRIGGPVFGEYSDPDAWIALVQAKGYRAAYCPIGAGSDDDTVAAYSRAAARAGIVIAEVGAWSSPLSRDAAVRQQAMRKCKDQLALAERIGARCCVNIAGSRGEKWAGPDPDNLTSESFDMIVTTVRAIIDDVQPTRTFYTLEAMPWMYPDDPDSYVRLIDAIDRPAFGVHLDPVNWVCSPQRYYRNTELIRESFAKLGSHIKSCHAKDIAIDTGLTLHLNEVQPGLGNLDYRAYLSELAKLDDDVPLMMEHMATPEEYDAAAVHIRATATELGLEI